MKRQPTYELQFSVVAVWLITGWYIYLARDGIPPSGGLVGHSLGIVGFVLMLLTEILYSLRKRVHGFNVGAMSTWLQWHVVTGIVGAYLVLLHSAGKFNGLAGIVMLLTLVVVLSGFVGRYIHTAVPRTLDGAEVAIRALEHQLAAADDQLQALGIQRLGLDGQSLSFDTPQPSWLTVLGRGWLRWRQRRRLRRALRHLQGPKLAQLRTLLERRYRLQMQIRSLAATRQLLSLWHAIHVPLGLVLFTLSFIHIGAALYYSTLMK